MTGKQEKLGLKPIVSSELGPWWHPGLLEIWGWAVCVCQWAGTWPAVQDEQSASQICHWESFCEEAWVRRLRQ